MKFEQIEDMVFEFAKTNKISKNRVEAFVKSITETLKPVGMGRKPSSDTLSYREKVVEAISSGSLGNQFTTNDLVNAVGGDLTIANNTLRYLKDSQNLVRQAGLKDKDAGQKGRRQVIWAM